MTSAAGNSANQTSWQVDSTTASEFVEQGILNLPGELRLHHGGTLQGVQLAWRVSGAESAPIVLVLGGISAHRVVYSAAGTKGWWDSLIGPGQALDSRQFRVLGIDFLGGSARSTGPKDADATRFPSISSYDQADLILRLLNHLSIVSLHAVVGASYGGMVALAFAEKFPERLERLLIISAADRTHPLATAWRSVQRRVLRYALEHGEGAQGVQLARALAMATYRSAAEFEQRFDGPPVAGDDGFVFPVEEYLFARGADYAAQYGAAPFLCLSESIDLHRIEARSIRTLTTLVGVREDQLVPLSDLQGLAQRLGGGAQLHELTSLYGHDAFLKESAALTPIFKTVLHTPPKPETYVHE
jgi:homoserine O-acetyltransferase